MKECNTMTHWLKAEAEDCCTRKIKEFDINLDGIENKIPHLI